MGNCNGCKKYLNPRKNSGYNIFTCVFLAILPKCPFCIMAFTSTAMLCGKDAVIESQSTHNSTQTILLTSVFCSLIIAGILLNYRGIRTRYALALAGLGILMILNSVVRNGGQELYYLGVSILFTAIWLNGSLISILRKFKNTFSGISKTAESSPYS